MNGFHGKREGFFSRLGRRVRFLLALFGLFSLVFVTAAITGFYERGARWLSTAEYTYNADYIVLLPSGPVPSPTMLMRAYKAAREYRKNPRAKVIVSHYTEPPMQRSTIWGIRRELILRGVAEEDILLETKARNTGEHAKYVREAGFGDIANDKYLIVTSSLHIKRSVMTFRSAGFKNVFAAPARGAITDEDLGEFTFFRYTFWRTLIEEIAVLRELTAIAWYKATGII